MENLPDYVETWILKRTGERHYLCRLCGRINDDHGTEAEFQRHLSSWPHRIRILKMEQFHCTVCDLQCKYQSIYNTHLKSKGHIQKVNPQPKPTYDCETCKVILRGRTEYERHNATSKHMRRVAAAEKHESGPSEARSAYSTPSSTNTN